MRLTYFFIFLFCSNLYASDETDAFTALINHEALKYASVGIVVTDVSSGTELHSHNANLILMPASVMKLVTSAAATSLLPKEWRYTTKFELSGQIIKDTLFGGITIMANGDPSFCAKASEYNELLGHIAAECEKRGIKYFTQEVLIWPPNRPDATPQTWLFEDIGNYYGSAAFGFNFKENSYDLSLEQNNKIGSYVQRSDESLYLDEFLTITNNVTTGAKGSGDQAYILGSPFNNERTVMGTIPPGYGNFVIKGSIPDPSTYFIKQFQTDLAEKGISLIEADSGLKVFKS